MSTLQAIRVEGGIFPASLFQRLQADELGDAASRQPSSYHLVGRESIRDAANRSWSYLTGAWEAWRKVQAKEPAGHDSTSAALARDRWLLVLLNELGYGRVPTRTGGIQVDEDDTAFPVSHLWQHVPIHLLGPGIDLDRRHAGVQGASRAPQAMVQELLNRSDDHLWAMLSNGRRLRLLRDSTALAGSAFVEFDLEAIFDGELFADFLLLWQTCHVSRLEIRTDGDDTSPNGCWLEAWRSDSVKAGSRALDRLRGGVENALGHLGTGFLAHPDNRELREALRTGKLTTADYHRHLLRLVYRLLFLFVTEDRDVLLDPSADSGATARYWDYLSTQRLRRQARERHGSPAYADLWRAQRLVLTALGGDGEPTLGLPALGGLFDPEVGQGDPFLAAELSNEALLEAIRDLAWIPIGRGRVQPVDYRNLGAEELGSVYEALLELVPRVSVDEHEFELTRLSGNERKTTGSYYTPPGLVSALLDSALDPVIDDAVASAQDNTDAEAKLLSLTVCDPACGSGHFLVAAARRVARRLAVLRSGEDEPTPDDVRHALRDVIGRCIYGVDLNPLAAELAKVSLWLEAMEPGKALGFLDARIRVGNSLLGATPSLLKSGIPDHAFKTLSGDDSKFASAVKKRNKQERGAFGSMQDQLDLDFGGGVVHVLAQSRAAFFEVYDDAASVRAQARRWRDYGHSTDYAHRKLHADAWSAAFVWPLQPSALSVATSERVPVADAPTTAIVNRFEMDPDAISLLATRAQVEALANEYRFFHWHLEFPEIFDRPGGRTGDAGWTGGFDCMIGNPPWERVKSLDKEFFARRDPEIANAGKAAERKKLIAALADSEVSAERALFREYTDALRRAEGQSFLLRRSGSFPLTGRGDVNLYAVFAELFRTLLAPSGQAGIIVQTGIATDDGTSSFFRDLLNKRSIAALYDFENGNPKHFEDVDSRTRFCLLTMTGEDRAIEQARYAVLLHDPRDILARSFEVTPEEIHRLNPNTGTLPMCRTRADAEIILRVYNQTPVLRSNEVSNDFAASDSWGVDYMTKMFDMSDSSADFRTRQQLESEGWSLQGNWFEKNDCRMSPLYEGKMAHLWTDKWATHNGEEFREVDPHERADNGFVILPRYWIAEELLEERLAGRWDKDWLMGWRDITNAGNERTAIVSVIPRVAAGNTWHALFSNVDHASISLMSAMSTFAYDYTVRQAMSGTHLTVGILLQTPVPVPSFFETPLGYLGHRTPLSWLGPRVALVRGESVVEPYRMDVPTLTVRAEVEAFYFVAYGYRRPDVERVLDSFTAVRKQDFKLHGRYRTRERILEVFDAMQHAIETGSEYQTSLDLPPGHGPRHELGAHS